MLTFIFNRIENLQKMLAQFFSSNLKSQAEAANNSSQDDSIIDVTGESYLLPPVISSRIEKKPDTARAKPEVPFWTHQYVYSYSAINDASQEQKSFYHSFKNRFLNGEFVDLEGNTNYAFVLLFDLLDEYKSGQDTAELEERLQKLGQFYPKTEIYATTFLARKMETAGDFDSAARIRYKEQVSYYDEWQLGNKYKIQLNLKDDERKLLNNVLFFGNTFCGIEYCCLETSKLYLATMKELADKYAQEETSVDHQFKSVADIVARNHFEYKSNSQNYRYCVESVLNDIYSNVFKQCENAVRESYGHKRKLSISNANLNAKAAGYESKIGRKVQQAIARLSLNIAAPDEPTEIELNAQNTTRWKIEFGELTKNYNGDGKQFAAKVLRLGEANRKNPSRENIFYEASKFIAKSDAETALALYLYYLRCDLESVAFDNKPLNKTIQKSLFKTDRQLRDFERIVSEYLADRDLEKALEKIPAIYVIKRRKIELDAAAITAEKERHRGTVELLNEYLRDDEEGEAEIIKRREVNAEEIRIEIVAPNKAASAKFISETAFTVIQIELLELFAARNFAVSHGELDAFARGKGAFRNQLIDSLNEVCYETLDDCLIEEADEQYAINQDYYQKLLAK